MSGSPKGQHKKAENSLSCILAHLGSPEKRISHASVAKPTLHFHWIWEDFEIFTITNTGLSLHPFPSLPHPPLKSVLSGWAGFTSGVIKGRGDEGQRGKERWRTEGGGTGTSSLFITRDSTASKNVFFFFLHLKCPFQGFISGLTLSPPVRFCKNWWECRQFRVVIKSFGPDDGGGRAKDLKKKRPCKSRQFVMAIHKTIFSLASNQKRVDSNDLANYEQFTSTSEITINTHEFQRVASNWLQWCCKFNTMDRSTKAPRN